jgi:hypothetical protein
MPPLPRMKILCTAMEEQDEQERRRMLHKVFNGYNASSDWPGFALSLIATQGGVLIGQLNAT